MFEFLQNTLLYVGSFVLVLSLVVFVHEFGHFQVGRWCGVAVKSFSIGLGSEWLGWTDKHGTRWKISKIPLGGFVSWIDDTDGSSTLPASAEHQGLSQDEARRRGHFRAMPIWKRAVTVAAGPAANFVFAVSAFALVTFIAGRDVTDYNSVTPYISKVEAGSAAAEAGMVAGVSVLAVNGETMRGLGAFQEQIKASPGQPLTLTIRDEDGVQRDLVVTPRATPQRGGAAATTGTLGVGIAASREDRVIERIGPLEAVGIGAGITWSIVANTADYIAGIFEGRHSGADIAGPLGIFNASGQVASGAIASADGDVLGGIGRLILALIGWAAMLSVAVGIVNLLPIPVLDGGHLLFYSIEAIRGGRPLGPMAQEWAYRAGFAAMAGLFLFATWNDISRLFPGGQ
jgi:regulator of sigma E protease